MSLVAKMLRFNRKFVENKEYEFYRTTKLPNKKIAVLSCMDTRLTGLLPAALNFKNGDIKIIKNAGASITHPFGSVMRSLVVAVYTLGVEEVFVVGHHDCGMQGLEPAAMIEKMLERGIPRDRIDMIRSCGVDLDGWLRGFDCVESSVRDTVDRIRNHPLIPSEINVVGFLMDPVTGKLDRIEPLSPEKSGGINVMGQDKEAADAEKAPVEIREMLAGEGAANDGCVPDGRKLEKA